MQQDAFLITSLPAEGETELPALWLHPLHKTSHGPVPSPAGVFSAKTTDIQNLLNEAATAVQKFSATFGFGDRRWLNEHYVSFGSPGLLINVFADGDAESSCLIPLRFSEVTHFRTKAGTLFLLIGLRKLSEHPVIEDFNKPFEEYWIVGVSSSDDAFPQSRSTLPKLLSKMAVFGAVRWDLHDSYDVCETIGTGGCASVHLGRARDPSVSSKKRFAEHEDGLVAVKILNPKFASQAIKEAVFLMGMTRHRNIIGFHGLFNFSDPASGVVRRWAVMMEYCSGGDLNDFLKNNGPCSEWLSAEIIFGLLSALNHLHSQGIVHRDVKSENILLMDERRPVLTDFGIAAYLDDAQAMFKKCGSPGYCAPEILECRMYNAKVDVFSSGVVLYYLVSGNLPFAGPDPSSMLRRNARCIVQMHGGCFLLVSRKLKSLIKLMLRKEQEERLDSSAALQQVVLVYGTHLKASSSMLDPATEASEPADIKVSSQKSTADSQLDTKDSLGRPTFSCVGDSSSSYTSGCIPGSEASSYDNKDVSPGFASFSSSKSIFTPRGLSFMQASEDPSHASDGPHPFTEKMQDQVTNHRCQLSKYLSNHTHDRRVLDEGAGFSTGEEPSGRQWSSETQDEPKAPSLEARSRRRFPMSCVGSFSKRPHAETASPKSAAELAHQAFGDNSVHSFGLMPHAPHRRLLPLFRRRQEMTDFKPTNTHVKDMQGIAPSSCEVEVMGEEVSGVSESDGPSDSRSSAASSCGAPGRSSNSGFNDEDGARPLLDNNIHEDSMLPEAPEDSLVNELPNLEGACSEPKFLKPFLPRDNRGRWQRQAPSKTGSLRQFHFTFTTSEST